MKQVKRAKVAASNGRVAAIWSGLLALTAAVALSFAASIAQGAEKPLKLEAIAGQKIKRVTLTPRAIERLGITVGMVREDVWHTVQNVGGEVVAPPATASPGVGTASSSTGTVVMAAGTSEAAREIWVRVALSERDLQRVAMDQPARVVPLAGTEADQKLQPSFAARPSALPLISEAKRKNAYVHYVVEQPGHGLKVGQHLQVDLPLVGSGVKLKTVPYSAVVYDPSGAGWVYLNPEPKTFIRHPVTIAAVQSDRAYLSEGPPIGSAIVNVGAMMLYGAETMGK
jgi:hypothetical protein